VVPAVPMRGPVRLPLAGPNQHMREPRRTPAAGSTLLHPRSSRQALAHRHGVDAVPLGRSYGSLKP
jgi:hypothetical protein